MEWSTQGGLRLSSKLGGKGALSPADISPLSPTDFIQGPRPSLAQVHRIFLGSYSPTFDKAVEQLTHGDTTPGLKS
jgi:hypothetical protein